MKEAQKEGEKDAEKGAEKEAEKEGEKDAELNSSTEPMDKEEALKAYNGLSESKK